MVDYCKERKIALTGHTTLGGAVMSSKTFSVETVKDIASKHKRSPAAVLQRWSIQNQVAKKDHTHVRACAHTHTHTQRRSIQNQVAKQNACVRARARTHTSLRRQRAVRASV